MSPRATRKVPAAVSSAAALIGRMGGNANTKKQQATRVANGRKSKGRPRVHPRGVPSIVRYHLDQIKLQGGEIKTDKQQAALDVYAQLQKEQK